MNDICPHGNIHGVMHKICYQCRWEKALDDIKALTQQLESARKDAERYRWLRDSGSYRPSYYGWVTDVVGNRKFSKEELDAAIDKAMKEKK